MEVMTISEFQMISVAIYILQKEILVMPNMKNKEALHDQLVSSLRIFLPNNPITRLSLCLTNYWHEVGIQAQRLYES